MYKELKFFKGASLDLEGRVKCVKERTGQVRVEGEYLQLNLASGWRKLSRKWLGLLAHYEYDLGEENLHLVEFVRCTSRLLNFHCHHLMVFKSPIYFKPGFRIVPGLTRYAVNEKGDVLSTFSGKQVSSRSIGPYGYPMTSCYDADKGRYRQVCTHILVARAWCKNDHPEIKIVVNHKDGIKTNIHRKNLEWVTQKGNSVHARDNGFHTDSHACCVYDIDTGEKWTYSSLMEATKDLGYSRTYASAKRWLRGRHLPQVYKDRYIVLREDEDSVELIRLAKETKDLGLEGPYQALNVDTKEVLESISPAKLGQKCGLSKSVVEYALTLAPGTVYRGYLFREKSEEPWPEVLGVRQMKVAKKIKAVNVKTDEVLTFPSIRQATTYFQCDKTTLKRRIRTGEEFDGFYIKEAS